MNPFPIVWKILTLPCSEAARLASESLDRPLTGHDRLAVRLHQIACQSCRRYGRQIVTLREVTSRLREPIDQPLVVLPEDARERIKQALKGD